MGFSTDYSYTVEAEHLGAFIKELMRRSSQFLLETGQQTLAQGHIESALDEMLFSGGSLNARLLGFAPKSDPPNGFLRLGQQGIDA